MRRLLPILCLTLAVQMSLGFLMFPAFGGVIRCDKFEINEEELVNRLLKLGKDIEGPSPFRIIDEQAIKLEDFIAAKGDDSDPDYDPAEAGNCARDLAKEIGGELASSRPIVDSGWLEPYHQIGSSGQTVAPKLYLALGISGAIQHIVGMKGSKNIVVINKDPNAPIFEIADYGIVADIFEIIPKLITEIQNN